jgi:2'-hydroxyisoflavone reductase
MTTSRGTTRRQFVKAGLTGAGALAVAGAGLACAGGAAPSGTRPASSAAPPSARPKPKTILVLGGTGFLGPHVVEAALARGHVLTLFNRGKTHAELFPDLEKLHGDRDGHLEALVGRKWDAVVDTSGYFPRLVKASAELLAPSVGHYVFVSTISVYADPVPAHADEATPVATMPDPTVEDMKFYGAAKALCEKAAEAAMPGRVSNVRPGLIVGPGDPTDRFTYWPARFARGGELLAPGDGSDPGQVMDARDLAAFLVKTIEDGAFGTFNATGPATTMTMKDLLGACATAAGAGAGTPVWVDTRFLEKMEVAPWMELPVWTGEDLGFATIDARKAIAAGLRFRPVLDTAADTLAWWKTQPEERRLRPKAGLAPEKEAAVLKAWKEQKA